MNCRKWLEKRSAATKGLIGSNFYLKFPRRPQANCSDSSCANCKSGRPTIFRRVNKTFRNRRDPHRRTSPQVRLRKRSVLEQQNADDKEAVHATRQALRRR